jgi:protein O-mannosyl-transferase
VNSAVLAAEKEDSSHMEKHSSLVFFLVLIITALIFSGSLNLEWTNWDDDLLVYKNPLVSEANFKDIFTKPAEYNTYNPLAISSFALEWKLVKDRPFLYHFDNFILHLICTALVWFFFRRLGLSVWWSGFAVLLFGIHPVRVESVVWIAERKDGLFGIFYLVALLAYIHYIASEKSAHLLLTCIFFILSILCKGQAVAMPLTLILLDWYFDRKISLKVVLEKVIFFATSLIIALMTVSFFVKNIYAAADRRTITYIFSFFEQLMLGGYAYSVYILKSIIPYAISPLYPMPTSFMPEHWIGGAMAVFILVIALAVWRKIRFLTFGLLFFTFNIFFLLMPFLMSETAYLFDHYTYVAYIGLFFAIAMGMQQLSEKMPSYRTITACLAVAMLAAYIILTIKYIPVWKNSETLWTYVIEKYPHKAAVAHLNRGHYWYENNRSDKSLEDFSEAIEINPDFPIAFQNRGLIYLEGNDFSKALQDYNRYLEFMRPYDNGGNILNPRVSDALGNRGLIYLKMGQYKKAMPDFDLAIKLNPPNPINYINRATACQKLGRIAEARQDLQTAEKLGAVIDPLLRKLLKPH